jgi:hypothetical protein
MKRLVTSAALIAVLVCAGSALAHGSTVRVSGIQAAGEKPAGAPGDPCRTTDPETGAPAGGYNAMTGSLIGCWYTDTGNPIDGTPLPDGVIVVAGTEHFVGCLDISHQGKCTHADPTGSLALTYTFEAQFSSPTNEIWGGCQHGIVPGMGTGGLAGAAGWLDFTDNVTNGTAAYHGYITLAGRRSGAHATSAAAARPRLPAARPRLPKAMC